MQNPATAQAKRKFGSIRRLESRIAEITINEGVVVDMKLALHLQKTLQRVFKGEFALLINEENSHSFTEDAQKFLGGLLNLKAMAVLSQMKFNNIAEQYLRIVHESSQWNLKVFHDRRKAVEWLQGKLDG